MSYQVIYFFIYFPYYYIYLLIYLFFYCQFLQVWSSIIQRAYQTTAKITWFQWNFIGNFSGSPLGVLSVIHKYIRSQHQSASRSIALWAARRHGMPILFEHPEFESQLTNSHFATNILGHLPLRFKTDVMMFGYPCERLGRPWFNMKNSSVQHRVDGIPARQKCASEILIPRMPSKPNAS